MKAIRVIAVLAIAALVFAPVATTYAGTDKDKATTQGKKTNEKQVTVVSVDPDAKTITIKDTAGRSPSSTPGGTPGTTASAGAEKTVPVTGQALSKLNQLRPGQTVTVTCTLNDAGDVESISDLKLDATSSAAPAQPSRP